MTLSLAASRGGYDCGRFVRRLALVGSHLGEPMDNTPLGAFAEAIRR
jgi:hypothetical protein